MTVRVLGIETSCDETGVAIFDGERGILAEHLYSQVDAHRQYGGVVPEIASRDHVRKLAPMVAAALDDACMPATALDGIAYTAGPGLAGALLAGAGFARGFAWGLNIPALGVHHMEAHLLAPLLEPGGPQPPFLALLVSGGHTLLVSVAGFGRYKIIGESLDDAAGEAFDKIAKMLELGYPGGPAVEALARQGDSSRFQFPRPMTDRPGLDMSFSGLKTHVANTLRAAGPYPALHADIARGFSDAVVDTFAIKIRRALQQTGMKTLVVAGGVSANQALRLHLTAMCEGLNVTVAFPRMRYATDNGAMIAHLGHLRLAAGERDGAAFKVYPRWPMTSLDAVADSAAPH